MIATRIQKEKRVIELYKQSKTIREISKEVHMSFGTISSIIRNFTGQDNKEKIKSKDTQAIKLFSQGKTPVDVVIELDVSSDEANKIYRDFWKLKRLFQLCFIYNEIKTDIPSFLKLFRMMKEEGFVEKDILVLLRYSNQLSSLDILVQSLSKKIKALTLQSNVASAEYDRLQEKIQKLENLLEQYQLELDELIRKIKIKYTYLQSLENSIDDLVTGDNYSKLTEIIERQVYEILNNKKDLLMTSIITVALSIRNDSNKGLLIDYFGYYDNENDYNGINNLESSQYSFKNYVQTYHQPLLEMTTNLYDKILKAVQNHILPSLSEYNLSH